MYSVMLPALLYRPQSKKTNVQCAVACTIVQTSKNCVGISYRETTGECWIIKLQDIPNMVTVAGTKTYLNSNYSCLDRCPTENGEEGTCLKNRCTYCDNVYKVQDSLTKQPLCTFERNFYSQGTSKRNQQSPLGWYFINKKFAQSGFTFDSRCTESSSCTFIFSSTPPPSTIYLYWIQMNRDVWDLKTFKVQYSPGFLTILLDQGETYNIPTSGFY
ncbi:uncharacterized protein LOC111713534 isoform X2 [Eurytemora carolleeae]|uniref:uncharacterized protein LOC111713534 isoform X2 n=1 Tax=Eurytemora carolleeae TaxID=1294199 RepID=UPI000C786C5E|nr:uncharacterized protein LOC111713534 isoform X2 [Eurytemora carolleeae]|eukprot:XP_023344178.1 uncharacterized protein LOC111713534 isoform X2 [Eurytemora affinis]